jgi:hypothetical protein|eukprot:COSAG06_NODE_8367_length_2193_cov_1.157593_2_plen_111_part_00
MSARVSRSRLLRGSVRAVRWGGVNASGCWQNVEFHMRRDRRGELRQGVYVSAKEGVRAGQELLISYGQGFWRTRLQGKSMEDFIYRRVGEQPQPQHQHQQQPAAKRAKKK